MATLVPELSLEAGDIERDHVEVLDSDGRLLGFLRLQRRRDVAWLADLFIDPELVGHGLGRQLFDRAVELGREWGCGRMEFDSDPNAEPFYRHLGAERVGTIDSQLVQGRTYPLMRYEL